MMQITENVNNLIDRLDDDEELIVYAVALIHEHMRRAHMTLADNISEKDVMDALENSAEFLVDVAFDIYWRDPVIH